jgi:hypothetical protein
VSYEVTVKTSIRDWEAVTRTAVAEMADTIKDKGRQDIASAGNFGSRWTQGLRVAVRQLPSRGYSVTIRLSKPNYAKVFEFGSSHAHRPRTRKRSGYTPPALWIGVNDAKNIRVRNYKGKLFQVKGRMLLMDTKDKQVKYVGVSSVTLKPRFHIRKIAEDEASRFFDRMNKSA